MGDQRQRGGARENLVALPEEAAPRGLSLTHTIVHSTVDKAKGEAPGGHRSGALHKVDDTEHGIVVRGARVLATLAPFADELAVYPGAPCPTRRPSTRCAFCIPMETPGLKFICRDSVSVTANRFDHPLSSRFDEQDAFVIFDDVEVPARPRVHRRQPRRLQHRDEDELVAQHPCSRP